ncbi:synaptic vesicle glycoprotein 2Ca [Syngnathoides biaculeatus]|uniref:synaptic vesicle glycoprotein 2Ca n=1 Tax=Syngnathoides biaculeatus TaxID=300417 RepID=UPI002ADD615E|nr:synaptic vesicle glycoprotein 2Ca [Syngnathoides biaculeatus]XP_061672005.1 synaptic vesicle glycoprotein 2Ca [Syngnathoides biaculeatus]XP_061672006.1 synaptic vesicle glycoprotein 2Ca [Syngnathoides biaculeatus]XP_061672007.1 synaptic vesicle glycoprotein 2Ca [Syngnathoides biaculeatus]XP_061672008.1 synaptic vesicle glycoprotein 2Ca [Syngnathoides biaculeatus]XP_061672009.1 synaptic vesicle glycoprotein 2Ca [Syngnathoides biaculeatus]
MEDTYNNRTSLVKGAKDMVKEAKRQATKKVNRVVDRAADEYSSHHNYSRFQDDADDDEDFYRNPPQQDGEGYHDNDEGSSDATEGHDDEDEIYEGEYQGVPSTGDKKLKEGQVALGQPMSDAVRDRKELEQERRADEEELAQQYELIIQECGHGRFQWQLFLVLGLALMSDGVEVFVVGFVLPSAETDMCAPDSSSGWLGSIVYLGMMLGAFFWGGMSDKVGRRQCLLVCMSTNGFFAFLSSFVQGYGVFLVCRLAAGFGIGGAVPIVFSFFAEVLSREKRGEHLSWLCMFWMIGEIYASAMAWAIIPHYGWSFSMGSAYQFHSWRVFVVVCALPCVCAVVALTFMPESPRFYLEVGKHDEAWMILKQIHDTNMRARGQPEKVFSVNRIKIPKQLDELIELESESGNPVSKAIFRMKAEIHGIYLNLMKCFNYPMRENMMRLAVVWFTLSFGYYGLSVWFPDVIKHLQADEYASKVQIHNSERIEDFTFNFTLENQIHKNGLFINDRFINMKLKSVTFVDSTFRNCYFDDVTSVGSYFHNCTFVDAFFFNTDIDDSKLMDGTEVVNSTFTHNKTGCQMTFDDDYSAYWVYFINFLGTLAVLPGNIVSALLMDKTGRLSMLGGSMVLSGISCFFLWFGTSESMMIFMLCLYNGLSISAWNSLDVVTTESFPTAQRGTGFGFCNALCKMAAVLGNLIFGSLVGITKAIPILMASSVLVGGGLVGLRLPDTRANVLM